MALGITETLPAWLLFIGFFFGFMGQVMTFVLGPPIVRSLGKSDNTMGRLARRVVVISAAIIAQVVFLGMEMTFLLDRSNIPVLMFFFVLIGTSFAAAGTWFMGAAMLETDQKKKEVKKPAKKEVVVVNLNVESVGDGAAGHEEEPGQQTLSPEAVAALTTLVDELVKRATDEEVTGGKDSKG